MRIILSRAEMRWLLELLRDEVDAAHAVCEDNPFNPEARENLAVSRRLLGQLTAELVTNYYEPSPMAIRLELN